MLPKLCAFEGVLSNGLESNPGFPTSSFEKSEDFQSNFLLAIWDYKRVSYLLY